MLKNAILVLLMIALLIPAPALAQSAQSRVFGYVIRDQADRLDILTDTEIPLSFALDPSLAGGFALDDVVLVAYSGSLNLDTTEQSATPTKVYVLSTFNGRVEADSPSRFSIRAFMDDGSNGSLYHFNKDDADILMGEEGILTGDEVEVAYAGDKSALVPDQLQSLPYVHVTIYGQVDGSFE